MCSLQINDSGTSNAITESHSLMKTGMFKNIYVSTVPEVYFETGQCNYTFDMITTTWLAFDYLIHGPVNERQLPAFFTSGYSSP